MTFFEIHLEHLDVDTICMASGREHKVDLSPHVYFAFCIFLVKKLTSGKNQTDQS